MESDMMSIASDFSIIPDCMITGEECESPPPPMAASFFRSEHSSEASASSLSPFTKVVFHAIEKLGSGPQAPLSVIFSVTDDFTLKSSDRIALYQTGFSSSKDFLAFKWAPSPSSDLDNTHPFTVMFEANLLPNDTEEWYQVCYLMQNGKISGLSQPFQLRPTEQSGTNEIMEKAARNVLSFRVNELLEANEQLKEELGKKDEELTNQKDKIAQLEQEMRALELSLESRRKMIKNLKEFAIEKERSLEKLTQESLETEKEMKQEKALNKETEEKLAIAVSSLSDLKDSLAATEQGKSITEERQEVLIQDNEDLKATLNIVKDELRLSLKERTASEKIATDLSQRLQTVCAECQNMAVTNTKLTKKVKKLRRAIALMEANTTDDWQCVDEEGEDKGDDLLGLKLHDDGDAASSEDILAGESMISSVMVAPSGCASTSCSSQHLTETVSSVRRMMDDIVSQLSLQTEEMKSLKEEIARRRDEPQTEDTSAESVQDAGGAVAAPPSRDCPPTEAVKEEEKRVIYGKSFLPAHCTAPVFLPSAAVPKEAPPQVTPPSQAQQQQEAASPVPSAPSAEATLPSPLLPETTLTARRAAVLRQLTDSNSLLTMDGVQQPSAPAPEAAPSRPPQESDDEDYHSTGDAGEHHPPVQRLPRNLKCPMCPLEFLPKALRLMEEHINNHLDRTCPVCSLAFQRNISQKTFEDHVQSHFDDRSCDEESFTDPSGPWDPRDSRRSFQLLEID